MLTHQIVPGKFSELSNWFKEADVKRKADGQIISLHEGTLQTGSVFKVVIEFEFEKLVVDDSTPIERGLICWQFKLNQISFHSFAWNIDNGYFEGDQVKFTKLVRPRILQPSRGCS